MKGPVVLRRRYTLGELLGRGGMGEVYSAHDAETGRTVAVKLVRKKTDLTQMARLQREAEAVMRLRSPYVPELYDVDMTEDGELFLVMERLEGEPLSERLAAVGGVLPWEDAARIGDDVLSGLVDAHEAGVIHRDLKPGNVFLAETKDGVRAMILDFGVAKLDRHDGDPITTDGEAVGTIAYMAPEQIRGASFVDGRADIYSFGVMMFEALTGAMPHDAEGQLAVIAQKLEKPARSLSDVGHVPIPAGVETLLRRCLRRRPDDRFPSAQALADAWRELGASVRSMAAAEDGLGASSTGSDDDAPRSMPPEPEGPVDFEPGDTTRQERRAAAQSSRAAFIVAASAVVGSVLLLALSWRLRDERPGSAPRPALSANEAPAPPVTAAPVPSFVDAGSGAPAPPRPRGHGGRR